MVQLPFNVLDSRFLELIKKISKLKIDVFLRSIFLQGLLVSNNINTKNKFLKYQEILNWNLFNQNSRKKKIISCLSFVSKFNRQNNNKFKTLFGFNSYSQFNMFVNTLDEDLIELNNFKSTNQNLINPLKW